MTNSGQDERSQGYSGGGSDQPEDVSTGDVKRGTSPETGDQQELLKAAIDGNREAVSSLVSAHLAWVQNAAQERAGRGLSEGDLVQEGSLGLVKAIQDFQASGRRDFDSFAQEQAAEQMDRALAEEGAAQEESRRLLEAAEDFQRAEFGLKRELGRDATLAEIAAKLEWPEDRAQGIAEMVTEARRRHDEELLQYLDPEDLDLERLTDALPGESQGGAGSKNGQAGPDSPHGSTSGGR